MHADAGADDLNDQQHIPPEEALQTPLSFGPASGSWLYPYCCWDVAVIDKGTLLVAARELGMKEYDTSVNELKELSCWTPPKSAGGGNESVETVAVLDDGRAAVGLRDSNFVVLLQRSSASHVTWLVGKRVQLQSPPRRLSVNGDLLAACETRRDTATNSWRSGYQLVLVKLSCGKGLNRGELDYEIGSVAVTAEIVVTSSYEPAPLSDGRRAYVVDGRSYSGDGLQLLWRHVSFNKVMDIVPFARVLYLAVCNEEVVRAIKMDDGHSLKDVVPHISREFQGIYALSLAKGKQSVLAVLSSAGQNYPCQVTAYPVSRSTC